MKKACKYLSVLVLVVLFSMMPGAAKAQTPGLSSIRLFCKYSSLAKIVCPVALVPLVIGPAIAAEVMPPNPPVPSLYLLNNVDASSIEFCEPIPCNIKVHFEGISRSGNCPDPYDIDFYYEDHVNEEFGWLTPWDIASETELLNDELYLEVRAHFNISREDPLDVSHYQAYARCRFPQDANSSQ